PEAQKLIMSRAGVPSKNGPVLRINDQTGADLLTTHRALLDVVDQRRGFREDHPKEGLPEFPRNPQTGQRITTEPLAGNLKLIEQLGKDRDVEGLKEAIDYHTDPN